MKRGWLFIAAAAILWAFDGLLRRNLHPLAPIVIVSMEHLLGSLILLPALWTKRASLKTFSTRDLAVVAWVALFSGLLGTLWFTTALLQVNYISYSVVFLLQKTQPLFALAAAAILLREPLTQKYLRWAATALIAAFFVTFPNGMINLHTGSNTAAAALYALLAAFAWGSSTAFSKLLLQSKDTTVVTAVRFLFTAILSVSIVFLTNNQTQLFSVTAAQMQQFLLITFTTGMGAMWIYYRGLRHTQVKVAAIIELLFPLTAVLIDVFVYGTILTWSQYLAGLVLVLAAATIGRMNTPSLTFTSRQITGHGRGKKIGVPTINLQIPPHFTLLEGIYAARVTIHHTTFTAALHYGPVPTYSQPEKSLEVHIIDQSHVPAIPLEQTPVTITIVRYLRPIQTFTSTKALVKQINADIAAIRSLTASGT